MFMNYDCSHSDFVTIIDLPEGEHQYKFCVDGNWQCDPKVVSYFVQTMSLDNIFNNINNFSLAYD